MVSLNFGNEAKGEILKNKLKGGAVWVTLSFRANRLR